MKLETKLNISTGVLVAAMFVSAFSVHHRMISVFHLATVAEGQRQPFIEEMRMLRGHLLKEVIAEQTSVLEMFGTAGHAPSHAAAEVRKQVEADLTTLLANGNTLERGPGEQALGDLAAQIRELQRSQEELESLSDPVAARALLQEHILPLNDAMAEAASAITRQQGSLIEEENRSRQQADYAVVITLWTVTLLGVVVGSMVSFILARRIADTVQLVADRANQIADGDLNGVALEGDDSDQIGVLAQAMNRMQASLGSIIGTVADTAGSLTGSAASMRSASDQIHRRIDQQSQQTQQAATAMQEMSASIAEVSRHTQSAAETARAAAQTAREGGLIVKQMLGSMQSIANAVTETSSTVGLLGDDSKRISQIVTVIDEIARKTNLLALNAAIEAARAGDQGRGFAVVAGEVRRLAESTAQATGEIGSMIQEIQERTRTAIASMVSGTGTVREGVVTTTQAGEALERIIGMAERVDRMITQIAIAASQQATAADQSSASLDSIHSLSHDNLNEMATTASGIESLRGTAVALERQVDRFHLQMPPVRRHQNA